VEARKAGWRANHKRIHRLWIAEGLRVPYRKRKKPLRGIGQPVGAMCPIRPNVVWGRSQPVNATAPDQEASREQREEVPERVIRS
jgi:putative transposase